MALPADRRPMSQCQLWASQCQLVSSSSSNQGNHIHIMDIIPIISFRGDHLIWPRQASWHNRLNKCRANRKLKCTCMVSSPDHSIHIRCRVSTLVSLICTFSSRHNNECSTRTRPIIRPTTISNTGTYFEIERDKYRYPATVDSDQRCTFELFLSANINKNENIFEKVSKCIYECKHSKKCTGKYANAHKLV